MRTPRSPAHRVALTAPPAQEAPARAKKLTVFIKPAKPFVFEKNGAPGFSIDLWKRVAEEFATPVSV
jgi:hypothetical protein